MRTIGHFWPELPRWLGSLPDTRFQPLVIYDRRFLAWWGLSLFVFKLRSRRQLDFDLREMHSETLPNLNRLAGTHQETLPVAGTLDHFLGHVGSAAFASIRKRMLQRLIRMKALDDERLQGYLVTAVDGSGWLSFTDPHCDRCLTQVHEKTTRYLHMILEAKIVCSNGLALSLGTEFIEKQPGETGILGTDENAKQDCELKALARLAPAVKKEFPQLSLCLTSDSLFGCGPAIQIAEDNQWAYVYTFKEGRMPAVWTDFQQLLAAAPENKLIVDHPDGAHRVYRWVNQMSYEDSEHRPHQFNALECKETFKGVTTRYAWITSLPLSAATVDAIAMKGGRIRWKIENEGFNMQKNSDLNLEHCFSNALEKLKAYYYLLQIAHIILQFLEKGSLLRRIAGKSPVRLFGSLRNIARRLLESFRYYRLSEAAFDVDASRAIQIRLSGN